MIQSLSLFYKNQFRSCVFYKKKIEKSAAINGKYEGDTIINSIIHTKLYYLSQINDYIIELISYTISII
jgi:hypothetical protein